MGAQGGHQGGLRHAPAPAEDEKTVIVTLTFKPGQIVRTTDQFALVAKGILGDMYIEQKPGPKDSPLAQEGQLFEGQHSFNLTDLLGGDTMSMVTDLAGSLKGIVDILKKNESEIDSTMKDIASRRTTCASSPTAPSCSPTPSPRSRARSTARSFHAAGGGHRVAGYREEIACQDGKEPGQQQEDLAASMKSIRASSADIQTAVAALTAQNTVISKLSAPVPARASRSR